MHIIWQDIRYSLRMISRDPAFAAIIVATLSLGIGANTAVFRVANARAASAGAGGVLTWLADGAALSLLIACVNSANLLAARGMLRRKDVAVRAALGAGRLRVFRLMLTESVLLALLGGAAGVLLAWWGVDILMTMAPPGVATLGGAIDGRALAFTLAVSVVSGALFGLAPALNSIGADNVELLKRPENAAPPRLQLLRGANLIAIAEVALALSILTGAGLMLESFSSALRTHPEFPMREQMRFETTLLAAFGAITLSLAMSGVYAVTCLMVGRRTREIGIRMALGARQSEVVRMVAGQAMTLVGIGSGVGLMTAMFASRAMTAMPYGASAVDLSTLLTVSAILAVTALPATYFPARAASKIEPKAALKSD